LATPLLDIFIRLTDKADDMTDIREPYKSIEHLFTFKQSPTEWQVANLVKLEFLKLTDNRLTFNYKYEQGICQRIEFKR